MELLEGAPIPTQSGTLPTPPGTCTPRMCSKLHCGLVLLVNAHDSLLKMVHHCALKITYLIIALRLPGEMHVSFLFNLCVVTKIWAV